MTRRRGYGQLQIWDEGRARKVSSLVADARRQARRGGHSEAIHMMRHLGELFQEHGLPEVVLELVSDLRRMVPVQTLDPSNEAWVLNLEGVARQQLGQFDQAELVLRRMADLGRELGEREIESTAYLNLGTIALARSNPERAKELFEHSLGLRGETGESRGSIQTLLNLCTVALESDDVRAASRILDRVEPSIRSMGEKGLVATLEGMRGLVAARQGKLDEAERRFVQALHHAQRQGQPLKVLTAYQNLGAVHAGRGTLGQALRWLRRGLRLANNIGAAPSVQAFSQGLGVVLHRLGRNREAVDYFSRARDVAESLEDRRGWAVATADLGALSINLGEIEQADAFLTDALREFDRLHDREWQAKVLRSMAVSARKSGTTGAARKYAERALGLIPETAHEDRADMCRFIAELLVTDRSTAEESVSFFARELEEIRPTANAGAVGWRAISAAALLADVRAFEEAIRFYTTALKSYSRLRDKQWVFHARNDRAIAQAALGRYREARLDLRACLALSNRMKDRAMRQRALGNLGETASRQGRLREAEKLLAEAARLARSLEDREREAESLGSLGIAMMKQGKWSEAERVFELAKSRSSAKSTPGALATALGGLAGIDLVEERFDSSVRLFQKAAQLRLHDQDEHYVEDLGGLMEALCALNRRTRAERVAQQLIDSAQRIGAEGTAAIALARSGRRFLSRRQLENAIDYYVASIGVTMAGVERKGLEGEQLAGELVSPFVFTTVHASDELGEGRDEFIDKVLKELSEGNEEKSNSLREWFDLAKSASPTSGPQASRSHKPRR